MENITLNIKEGIAFLEINRPKSLNALNSQTLEEIKIAFDEVNDNSEIKGVVVTGSGDKAFVAGADIKEIAGLNEVNARKFAESGQEIFYEIESCEKPVVAVVNGFALGGGCELAMACHIRVATESARFGQPEVNLGLIPGYGGTQRLTQLVGKGKALELMMTADMVKSPEALALGLVNYVEPTKEDAMEKAISILSKITQKAPIAIGRIIDSVNSYYKDGEDGYLTEANGFSQCCNTEDFKEGTTAFIEKRAPEFKGE